MVTKTEGIMLERLRVAIQYEVSKNLIQGCQMPLNILAQVIGRGMVFSLHTFVLAEETQKMEKTIKYPDGWWQAVKERWFPDQLKKHYPVRYCIEYICLRELATLPKCAVIPEKMRGPIIFKRVNESWRIPPP